MDALRRSSSRTKRSATIVGTIAPRSDGAASITPRGRALAETNSISSSGSSSFLSASSSTGSLTLTTSVDSARSTGENGPEPPIAGRARNKSFIVASSASASENGDPGSARSTTPDANGVSTSATDVNTAVLVSQKRSYFDVKTDFYQTISANDSKKVTRLLSLMKELLRFQELVDETEPEMMQACLTLFSMDNAKLARFAYFMLAACDADKAALMLRPHIESGKGKSPAMIKAYSIIVLSKFSSPKKKSALLRDVIFNIVHKYVANARDPKRHFPSVGQEKERELKHFVVRAAFQAIRKHYRDADKSLIEDVKEATRSRDPDIAREAIRTLLIFAKKDPSIAAPIQEFLPKASKTDDKSGLFSKKADMLDQINVEEPFSRVHLVKFCSTIVESGTSKALQKGGMTFVEYLKLLIRDESLQVFFETVKILAMKQNFKLLMENDSLNPATTGTLLLDYVVNRIVDTLTSKDSQQIHIHAACRGASNIAAAYVQHRHQHLSGTGKIGPNIVIARLGKVVLRFLYHECPFVRLQAYKTLLWVYSSPSDINKTVRRLKLELQGNTIWSSSHVHDILSSFLGHVKVEGQLIDDFADLCAFCCMHLPHMVDPRSLVRLFEDMIELNTRKHVLKIIYNILDNCMTGSSSNNNAILRAIYAFLGDNATVLTTEEVPMQSETRKSFKTEMPTPTITNVYNPAMKSILMRMMRAALNESYELKMVCVEGLGKIALRSQNPIRIYIYNFLACLCQDRHYGAALYCVPILSILDEVYQLHSKFLQLTKQNCSSSDLSMFLKEHEQVTKRISMYIPTQEDFLPLGESSRSYLATAGNYLKQRR